MLARLAATDRRRRPTGEERTARAADLARRYLHERAGPTAARWVDSQEECWGSCAPSSGSVRITDRVQGMPLWVIDYVLLHELAHLIEPGHGQEYWDLLAE